MSDLSGKNPDQNVRLVGVNTGTGLPDNFVEVFSDGSIAHRLLDGSGTSITVGQKVSASSLPVVIASDQSAIPVSLTSPSSDRTGSGTITSGSGSTSFVSANTQGSSLITFDILGTWVATIIIESTIDGTNWFSTNGDIDVSDSIASSFTTNTFVTIPCGSFTQVRLRASLYTSGTANITWDSSQGGGLVEIFNTNASSLITTSRLNDGSGNAINSFNNQLQVRDGLNVSSQYRAQSVTTSAAEALGAGTILAGRKLLSITPTNGTIYWGFSSSITTVTGTPLFPNNTLFLSVTDNVHVYLISAVTTDVRIAEVS